MVDAYNGLLEENKKLKYEKFGWVKMNDNLEKRLEQQKKKIGEFKTKIASCKNKNMQLEDENRQLKELNETLTNECWGLEMTITQLKKQVEELDFKLKESMTDKYVLKKIPSGRKPKSQTMKLKDCSRVSNISRKVFGDKQMKKTIISKKINQLIKNQKKIIDKLNKE